MPDVAAAPHPLLSPLGRVLGRVLDRVIDLDPDTRRRLGDLDGRSVTLELGDGRANGPGLRLTVDGTRLRVGPVSGGDSALRVTSTIAGLAGFALTRARDGAIAPGKVTISGDAELARRLERLARSFAPDFDEAFARAFGDVAGFQLARAFRAALAWARSSASALAADAAEFLTEEGRDLVARAELDAFLDEVDAERERADRLEARLRRLAARVPARA